MELYLKIRYLLLPALFGWYVVALSTLPSFFACAYGIFDEPRH